MRLLVTAAMLVGVAGLVIAQGGPLTRRYVEDERVQYLMKARNDGATYEIRLTGVVKKGPDGGFVEEYSFGDMVANGNPAALSPEAQAFRIAFRVQKGHPPFSPPNLSTVPRLIGPITDLMTFYADLFLTMTEGDLRKPGDRFRFQNADAASWADGNFVVIGEDAIDFDITLVEVRDRMAVVAVKHVPPAEPRIRIPADWMRTPVADTPNNWVQVRKSKTGYVASVGKETFDVELRIDLADGKILSARMDNPVTKITRDCADMALTQCGDARPDPTLRQIEMTLVR